jgi:S1-C subfamily serine protease
VTAYDVGLLYVEERTDNHFHIAPKAELEKLDSGYRVAFLGFPMERMQGGGINIKYPVATMQSGILTSATDYWLSKAEFVNRLLLQHNLGATGGASGSPIFNVRGEVVGVLSAGNIIGQVVSGQGKVEVARAPSAVMVNFAQRIDCLKDILPEYPRD